MRLMCCMCRCSNWALSKCWCWCSLRGAQPEHSGTHQCLQSRNIQPSSHSYTRTPWWVSDHQRLQTTWCTTHSDSRTHRRSSTHTHTSLTLIQALYCCKHPLKRKKMKQDGLKGKSKSLKKKHSSVDKVSGPKQALLSAYFSSDSSTSGDKASSGC